MNHDIGVGPGVAKKGRPQDWVKKTVAKYPAVDEWGINHYRLPTIQGGAGFPPPQNVHFVALSPTL